MRTGFFHRAAVGLLPWVLATACAGKDDGQATSGNETGGAEDTGTTGETFNPSTMGQSNTSVGTNDGGGTTSGGSMDTGSADEAGFIMPPDGGVEGQCDPAMQDCPEGEKCTSYVSTPGGETVDATKCVPIIGNAVAGDECERMEDNDTCDAGFFCMTDVSGHTGPGVCLEYCTPGQPCEYGGECFAFNDGALPVCEVLCDPLLQDCSAGQGCYAAFDNFVCANPAGDAGVDGDTCATIQGCEPGLLCKSGTQGCNADSGCCTPVCDMNGGAQECPEQQEECLPALDNPPPGLQDVGYCAIPQ